MERTLTVLLADDEAIIHVTIGDYLRELGHRVEGAHDGKAALEMMGSRDYDIALVDLRMPEVGGMEVLARAQKEFPTLPIVMITGHGSMQEAIRALRLGAADFLTKPVKLGDIEAVLARCATVRNLREGQERLRETIHVVQKAQLRSSGFKGLVGGSNAVRTIRHQMDKAIEARCDTILLTGETGVGKEVVAREIHVRDQGGRTPFIPVNCPAIPESLVESELFGHVKGAFTGASDNKAGCFELANGGSLLLDEIADLSSAAQAKLLRVLETRTVRRVGSGKETAVSVRVIAATNVPMERLVSESKFRKDLFYRLNVFRIDIPPLREHKEDIPLLAEHFLSTYTESRRLPPKSLSAEALQRLKEYDYPGNVRELRNVVERAAIMGPAGTIEANGIIFTPIDIYEQPEPTTTPVVEDGNNGEREHVAAVLEKHRWNRRRAAEELGLSYSGLRYKISKYHLE